jgi:protein phosphatase
VNTFSITDTGRLRTSNQDQVFCGENEIGSFPNLFLVADGMGGHKAGDTASKMCVEAVVDQIRLSKKKTPVSVFEEAVKRANRRIYDVAQEHFELQGMGTTLVGTTIAQDTAFIVNVGDSRLYHLRDELRQITVDHSLVEEMVQSGEIQKEEMRTHPNKNIITRALGTNAHVRTDCFEIEVKTGDVLLLCSDGLTNMLEDYQIETILRENSDSMEQAGKDLVNQANEAGGKDNISVILIQI